MTCCLSYRLALHSFQFRGSREGKNESVVKCELKQVFSKTRFKLKLNTKLVEWLKEEEASKAVFMLQSCKVSECGFQSSFFINF